MNPENICANLAPKEINKLKEDDSFKIMYNMQKILQDRIGKIEGYFNMDMHEKCKEAIYNMHCLQDEFSELIARLPWKEWKTYSTEEKMTWLDDNQRDETLMEYIDMLHFFIIIGIIFDFSEDEIFAYYKEKNKENFRRQESGY